jgi:hypothetical protein
MSIFALFVVVIYLLIAVVFNLAMISEFEKDEENNINPLFIKISMFATSALWPLLILVVGYKKFKESTK